jgi:hypothetical protein
VFIVGYQGYSSFINRFRHTVTIYYPSECFLKHDKVLQARDSKEVTNGSKTSVMHVIGFLGVSLGSSTAQLHDSLGSLCTCSEPGSVVTMATMLEMCTTKEKHSVVLFFFCWQKD